MIAFGGPRSAGVGDGFRVRIRVRVRVWVRVIKGKGLLFAVGVGVGVVAPKAIGGGRVWMGGPPRSQVCSQVLACLLAVDCQLPVASCQLPGSGKARARVRDRPSPRQTEGPRKW